MEQQRKTLHTFSTLFLILAACNLITFVIPLAQGEYSVSSITSQLADPNVSEGIVKGSIIAVVAFAVLSILALLYMGVMGLRQYKGKPTGTSHIKIAKICLVFMVFAALVSVISLINNPVIDWDNWIGMCSNLGSVLITYLYIKAAKSL